MDAKLTSQTQGIEKDTMWWGEKNERKKKKKADAIGPKLKSDWLNRNVGKNVSQAPQLNWVRHSLLSEGEKPHLPRYRHFDYRSVVT